VLRALLAGPADPVAAPAKALAVAAVLTVGTGGVASDVRQAPPKAAATTATAPKNKAKPRHAVHKRAVVVRRAAVVAAVRAAPKPQGAPLRGQSPEWRPDQAHTARAPCPQPTQTSQPAPMPS
jgi:hypothetical protein